MELGNDVAIPQHRERKEEGRFRGRVGGSEKGKGGGKLDRRVRGRETKRGAEVMMEGGGLLAGVKRGRGGAWGGVSEGDIMGRGGGRGGGGGGGGGAEGPGGKEEGVKGGGSVMGERGGRRRGGGGI